LGGGGLGRRGARDWGGAVVGFDDGGLGRGLRGSSQGVRLRQDWETVAVATDGA